MGGQVNYEARMVPASVMPLHFNEETCIACNHCVQVCPCDILLPAAPGHVPTVAYPGECWYCGACVMECPREGALTLRHPLMNRARFIPREDLGNGEDEEKVRDKHQKVY